jgi:hypothetical protein
METTEQTHKIQWWAYARDGLGGIEKIRRSHSMRGTWGYDVTCSCGWESKTGGAIRSYIEREVWWHKAAETA